MITIKELLNRIKWDRKLKPSEYSIFYYDRILDKLIEVKYNDILKIEDGFLEIKSDNKIIEIPLHRIKKVTRNGKLIWQR